MERYCGDIVRHIKNRRYPYISINNYVTASAQLAQVKIQHDLHEELSFAPRPDQDKNGHIYVGCKRQIIIHTWHISDSIIPRRMLCFKVTAQADPTPGTFIYQGRLYTSNAL